MRRKDVHFSIPWPNWADLWRWTRKYLLPNPGTIILIALLFYAQAVGAGPFKAATTQSTTIPRLISYQGRLTDAVGDPVANGNYRMVFSLYCTQTGGEAFWFEDRDATNKVPVSDGFFNVLLGQLTSMPASFPCPDGNVYLGIRVDPDPTEMEPRELLASVPYAFQAVEVPDGSIITEKIATDAITTTHMLDGVVATEKIQDNAVTSSKIAHQFGASNAAMLNFVPRDPTGWDYDDNSQGTYDIDLSGIVSSTAVGVKVLVSYKLGGGRRFWLYPKGKTDHWDRIGWYSWNDAEALSGRQRQFTYDLFFGDYRQLTVQKNGASWGGNELFKLAVIGWWEPAYQ